ncbi:MAG: GMC family oxidoreductase [Bryobacteraceae bacterium]
MAKKIYDVLIVGSGHSGGMAAHTLTQKGVSCLMLNAGPVADLERDRTTKAAHELPYRGFGKPGEHPHIFQANEFNANTWVNEREVPYTHDRDAPYNWVRVRLLGGRSLFWARQSFRLSDYEFKAADHDGFGDNWPLSLADLDPYYSRVEEQFKVVGRKEGWKQFPDGNFVSSPGGGSADSECVKRLTAAAQKMGYGVSRMRAAMGDGGLASSVNLCLPGAVETGKLDIVPNAVVREIKIDKGSGKAAGVCFVERHSRREMEAYAKVVVLAAGTLESTRLLLNSGICNTSGTLGRYLFDQQYGATVVAAMPEAMNGKARPGMIGGGVFIPRFQNLDKSRKLNFLRGYAMPMGTGSSPDAKYFPAYGAELQKLLDTYAGACIQGGIYGEVLPRKENHVRIDKTGRDAWGIPTLHIEARYSDNERQMAQHAADTMEEMYKAAGFELLVKSTAVNPPGYSIHELGTARMGDNPKTSVLNRWNQSHDIKNIFVVDGASFVTGGWQNPTMTILALSMRASEYLAEQLKKGEL